MRSLVVFLAGKPPLDTEPLPKDAADGESDAFILASASHTACLHSSRQGK